MVSAKTLDCCRRHLRWALW